MRLLAAGFFAPLTADMFRLLTAVFASEVSSTMILSVTFIACSKHVSQCYHARTSTLGRTILTAATSTSETESSRTTTTTMPTVGTCRLLWCGFDNDCQHFVSYCSEIAPAASSIAVAAPTK